MKITKSVAGYHRARSGTHRCPVLLFTSAALVWLRAAPPCSFAFAPVHHLDGNLHAGRCRGYLSNCGRSAAPRMDSFLHASVDAPTAPESSPKAKEFSYAAILKAIDDDHYTEATQSCPYLASESTTLVHDAGSGMIQRDDAQVETYQSPTTPALSDDAVKALRSAAQSYFEGKRGENNGALGIERVDLGELLSAEAGINPAWKKDLNGALVRSVYPLVRSGWPHHDAFALSSSTGAEGESTPTHDKQVLTVTSASIFAGGGYPGAKAAMTMLERDAGMFVVHIDLGNEDQFVGENSVMGALYLESLAVMQSTGSIVGPLSPGQMVVHRSKERTAVITVPSNIHQLGQQNESSLDSVSRTQINRSAESARHYALRLVLTTKNISAEATDGTPTKVDTPESPSEERSYRLRSYARFREDRVRYLALAGLLDVDDYENQLWLGFDYISRADNPDYQFELRQRLSDVNKAVFHLETAATLCPTDARVHFQLATAIGAKMDCEKRLISEGNGETDITWSAGADRAKVAAALERSAQLESAAVKAGVNGIEDLSICLNALAQTRCELGEYDKALDAMDRWAECGSIRSALAVEDNAIQLGEIPNHEWIQSPGSDGKGRNVAVRTVGDTPLFQPEDIDLLRSAADRRFALAAGIQTSRYTMQYEGNSEVHLDDLCASDPILKTRMDKILQEKVYPLVRSAFAQEEASGGDVRPLGSLCVYDSIFVRYNGDVAKAAGRIGASQPLHQDGGIYSVNIALNAHKDDDENGFTGGGTFLEALTVGVGEHIQRPVAPGHAIVHKTTQRHAGAPTTSGVRDILVIFLTARQPEILESDENTWRIERAMRLQSIAKELLQRDKLISCLQLARENDPNNSEISYWLGVHLIQGDVSDPSDERWEEICQGVGSLEQSTLLNPADARAHYHFGMAISTRHKYAMRTRRAHLLPPPQESAESLINAFETAIILEGKCDDAGCKNEINLAAAYLALGDYMARLKDFDKAIAYLNQVEDTIGKAGDMDKEWAQSMIQEVFSILDYCKNELVKKNEASLASS